MNVTCSTTVSTGSHPFLNCLWNMLCMHMLISKFCGHISDFQMTHFFDVMCFSEYVTVVSHFFYVIFFCASNFLMSHSFIQQSPTDDISYPNQNFSLAYIHNYICCAYNMGTCILYNLKDFFQSQSTYFFLISHINKN